MLSFSSIYGKNYFETNRLTYKEFIKKLEINESDNNILFIIPITCLEHYSLMLVHNYKIYLLDYCLVNSSDKGIFQKLIIKILLEEIFSNK